MVQVWKNDFILQCGPHLMRSQPLLVSTTKLAGLPTAVLGLEERSCTGAAQELPGAPGDGDGLRAAAGDARGC